MDQHAQKQLKRALYYAGKGWPVFPLHVPEDGGCSCGKADCSNIGKHPLHDEDDLPNGLLNATLDPALIERWWRRWEGANIAIVTGVRSGLVVLDIDPRHDGDHNLHGLLQEHGALPDTVQVLTGGGGQHYYFKHPGGTVNNRSGKAALAAGVEIKGDGGYVVAAGSIHAEGIYQWEASSHPDDVPLAELPAWLLRQSVIELAGGIDPPAAGAPAIVLPKDSSEKIPAGERNNALTRLAGSMRRLGATEDAIYAALLADNLKRCEPPLPGEEVHRIARSVARYQPQQAQEWRVRAKDDAFTSIEPLIKIGTDPPRYIAHVTGREVRVPLADLAEFKRFKLACIAQLDMVPVFPVSQGADGKDLSVQATWEKEFLAPALINIEERLEQAPEDAGLFGATWQSVLLFFRSDRMGESKDDVYNDRLVKTEGHYWFRGRQLRTWLAKNNLDKLKPDELWTLIRDKGGKPVSVRSCHAPNGVVKAWQVPICNEES